MEERKSAATMVLGMLRSVAGWKADKYRFDVTIHNAYNVLPGTKALQVVWKRGNKHAQTKVRDRSTPLRSAPVPNRNTRQNENPRPGDPSSRIHPRPLTAPHRPDDPPLTTNPSHR